jgi:hypothetical protein
MLGGLTVLRSAVPGLLEDGVGRLIALAALTAAGFAIYALVASALRAPELAQMRSLLARRRTGGAA